MIDRQPTYPGRVKLVPVSGQENVYDMVRADEPTAEGTPLNKETLLSDATAALLELSAEEATPNLAIQVLFERIAGLLTSECITTDLLADGAVTAEKVAAGIAQLAVGSYTGTGTYGASNPTTINVGFVPKYLVIQHYNDNGLASMAGLTSRVVWGAKLTSSYATDAVLASSNIYTKLTNNTVYLYATSADNSDAFNTANMVYYWYALG